MRTVGRPRKYLEILVEGDFLLCFFVYWEETSLLQLQLFFWTLFFFTWFKWNEFFFHFFGLGSNKTMALFNAMVCCKNEATNWSFESCLKERTKLDGCFSTHLWSSQSGTYVPSTFWKHFHWWINKSTEINISQQKSTNIKPAPGTGTKPEKFLSSESGRCPTGLQCLRTLMWNRGPPWASRWNGKHQQLMVRHIWVGSGRDIHILLDIPWYECPYSDCFYISFLCFFFHFSSFWISKNIQSWETSTMGCPKSRWLSCDCLCYHTGGTCNECNVQVLYKKTWRSCIENRHFSVEVKEITSFISLNRWWRMWRFSGMAILFFYDTRDSYRSIPRRRMEWLHQPRFSESLTPLDSVENGGSWWLAVWCFNPHFWISIHLNPFISIPNPWIDHLSDFNVYFSKLERGRNPPTNEANWGLPCQWWYQLRPTISLYVLRQGCEAQPKNRVLLPVPLRKMCFFFHFFSAV